MQKSATSSPLHACSVPTLMCSNSSNMLAKRRWKEWGAATPNAHLKSMSLLLCTYFWNRIEKVASACRPLSLNSPCAIVDSRLDYMSAHFLPSILCLILFLFVTNLAFWSRSATCEKIFLLFLIYNITVNIDLSRPLHMTYVFVFRTLVVDCEMMIGQSEMPCLGFQYRGFHHSQRHMAFCKYLWSQMQFNWKRRQRRRILIRNSLALSYVWVDSTKCAGGQRAPMEPDTKYDFCIACRNTSTLVLIRVLSSQHNVISMFRLQRNSTRNLSIAVARATSSMSRDYILQHVRRNRSDFAWVRLGKQSLFTIISITHAPDSPDESPYIDMIDVSLGNFSKIDRWRKPIIAVRMVIIRENFP